MVTLWTATPHKQPPLDLTELENVGPFHLISVRLPFRFAPFFLRNFNNKIYFYLSRTLNIQT